MKWLPYNFIKLLIICVILVFVIIPIAIVVTDIHPNWIYSRKFRKINEYIGALNEYKYKNKCYPVGGKANKFKSDDEINNISYDGGCNWFKLTVAVGFDDYYEYNSENDRWLRK